MTARWVFIAWCGACRHGHDFDNPGDRNDWAKEHVEANSPGVHRVLLYEAVQ